MKTQLLSLITIICTSGVLFTGTALGQEASPGAPAAATMKAIVYHHFGSPDVLRLEEIPKPVPNENQVLMNAGVALVEIVEIGAFLAAGVVAVAVRTVQQEQVTALARPVNAYWFDSPMTIFEMTLSLWLLIKGVQTRFSIR